MGGLPCEWFRLRPPTGGGRRLFTRSSSILRVYCDFGKQTSQGRVGVWAARTPWTAAHAPGPRERRKREARLRDGDREGVDQFATGCQCSIMPYSSLLSAARPRCPYLVPSRGVSVARTASTIASAMAFMPRSPGCAATPACENRRSDRA